MWNKNCQFGYLTDFCCDYYHIAKGGCVLIQNKKQMFCVHALTYIYKRVAERSGLIDCLFVETPYIFASPLNSDEIVGRFTQTLLVCDTLLNINNVQWAILHHMMYTPLDLAGIPQAWVKLEDGSGKYFEKMEVGSDFEERLKSFRIAKGECGVC